MKIGVDARLFSRSITGVGRYTLEMCRALSSIKGAYLYLYSPSPINSIFRKDLETSTFKTGELNNLLLRQFWSEIHLPIWVKQDEIDVFWGPAHRLPYFLSSKTASIVTIHDLVWKFAGETMRPLSRILEHYQVPLAIKKADHIVADSIAMANSILKEFPISANKLSVVPLGSDHFRHKPDSQHLRDLNIFQPYFLFVGTPEPRKNLINLLIAYSKLSEDTKKKCTLLIVGSNGWGGVDLESTINSLNLTPYTRLLGYIDDPTLATLYANAKFLVMPSLYEGFGLPLVEAMAFGTPVLTSNNSSMIEVAGNAGILVDPLDTDSIKHGLLRLLNDDNLLKSLALNTQENVNRYNWQLSANLLFDVFKKVTSERSVEI